jgi:hypothetical protein
MLVVKGSAEDKVNSAPANISDTIACMSQAPYGPGPAAPSGWPPQGPPPSSSGPSRVPTIIAIVIALIAVAVAIAAWLRPAPRAETPAAKTYSEQEIADAKKAVCDAFGQTRKAIEVTNHKDVGPDPAALLAVAANGRIALTTGADYLLAETADHPALAADLLTAVKDLSNSYRRLAIEYMAEAPQDAMEPIFRQADDASAKVRQFCT